MSGARSETDLPRQSQRGALAVPVEPRLELSLAESPAIHTSALVKQFGAATALDGLSMTVRRGEVFGFLGPNGAGKTTAVKLLVGLSRPSSGDAWVLGEAAGDRETRRRIGYLPELFRYQDWMSAREVLALHCELMRMPRAVRSEQIDLALELVALQDRGRDRIRTFSKGMQQRLGLGVALLGTPDLVFLDEPTSALDPVGRHDVREIIRDLKHRGATVFLNSHLLSEVEQVCDRVAVIDRGRVIASGTIDELRGEQHAIQLRLAGLTTQGRSILDRFGTVDVEEESYTVRGIEPNQVPQLVAALVGAGARVYAVEPRQQSLEDRFLELLGGHSDGTLDHRAPNSA